MAVSTREDELVCVILDMVEQRKAQRDQPAETLMLTPEFTESVDACINVFEVGDIPGDCKKLYLTVLKMKSEWQQFEQTVSPERPMPSLAFFRCVDELENELTFSAPSADVEFHDTIASFRKEGLTDRQIAVNFSWNGVGPFMKAGIPQPALVKAEEATPGSIIPKDWVHPMVQEARDKAAKYSNRLAKRADELRLSRPEAIVTSTAPVGIESIEELLRQAVPEKQVTVIKHCSLDEVLLVKERLAAQARGEVGPTGQAEAEIAIELYLADNPKARNPDVAKAVGCDVRQVALVRNKLKETATV